MPKEVSPTGDIGHTHSVSKRGDTLTVTVNYGKTGEKKTETLSVAELYLQFVAGGETVRYELCSRYRIVIIQSFVFFSVPCNRLYSPTRLTIIIQSS